MNVHLHQVFLMKPVDTKNHIKGRVRLLLEELLDYDLAVLYTWTGASVLNDRMLKCVNIR